MAELSAAAEEKGRNSEQGGLMLAEYHQRLVLPVGCLVLSMFGLPLGLLAGPGKKAIGIPVGLGIFILYYILFATVKTLAESGAGPAFLLMWIPNIFFFLGALYCIQRVANELPIISETFQQMLIRMYRATLLPLLHSALRLFRLIIRLLTIKK